MKEPYKTNLFVKERFITHAELQLEWKIECDSLSDDDIGTLAWYVASKIKFGSVLGIPRGGLRLASALDWYKSDGPLLLVDDVLTTGKSMTEAGDEHRWLSDEPPLGVVIFARGACPGWVTPIFNLVL